MKLIINIHQSENQPAGYLPFLELVLSSLTSATVSNEWLLKVNKGEQPIINPSGFAAASIETGRWYHPKTQQLVQWLNNMQCGCYVYINGLTWTIYKPKTAVFSENDLKEGAGTTHSFFDFFAQLIPVVPQTVLQWSWNEAQLIKDRYSWGKDYFLFLGAIDEVHNLVNLLKAYSVFKEWQQSNMQLLIAGWQTSYTKHFEGLLQQYKYRNDVQLIRNPSFQEQELLLRSCYAMVYPCLKESNTWPLSLVQAAQHQVAVIASDLETHRQISKAAIWVDNDNFITNFSNALQLLYKDEAKKASLSLEQQAFACNYRYDELIKKLCEMLMGKDNNVLQ